MLFCILKNKHTKCAEASRCSNKLPDAYSVGTRTEFQRQPSVSTRTEYQRQPSVGTRTEFQRQRSIGTRTDNVR